MKLKTERDLSYIDLLTVVFFQNNGMSSISVILLTNGWKEGRTDGQINGHKFNTSLAEVKISKIGGGMHSPSSCCICGPSKILREWFL